MRQQRTFLLLSVIVSVLVLGIGYAAITSVTLNVNGNVTGTPDQANFNVKFAGAPTWEGSGSAVLQITGDRSATIDVSGLKTVGDSLTARFTVMNASNDIDAVITHDVSFTNSTYFNVTASFEGLNYGYTEENYWGGDESAYIAHGGYTATLVIKIDLIKTPVSSEQTTAIDVSVNAAPAYIS